MEIIKHLKGCKAGFVWWLTNSFICNFPSNHIRLFILKLFGMKIHGSVKFYEGFHIRSPHKIIIENGVSIGPHVLLDGRMGLHINKSAVLGYECIIWTLNHDYNDVNFCGKGAPVEIGPYAWICSRSIILPGIKIGEGAVIASGAVVTHDVPPYSVVAGVPARIIGRREEKEYQYGYNSKNSYSHFG